MSQLNFTSPDQQLTQWLKNTYPINDSASLIQIFGNALTEIHKKSDIHNKSISVSEYHSIYNLIMLNPIFDSHPINFKWSNKTDQYLKDILSAIKLANDIFETIETKNAYLISLAVASQKNSPPEITPDIIDQSSIMIFEEIFRIENEDYSQSSKAFIKDDYKHTDDGQALAFQIQYHRWMILNKSLLPETSYMRNRFINIVIRKNFPKHTPNPENKIERDYALSREKLKLEIANHLKFGNTEFDKKKLEEWIETFVNNVMLVYYGFYKWDKLRGDFYKVINLEKMEFGEKIPDSYEPNIIEFSKFIKIA